VPEARMLTTRPPKPPDCLLKHVIERKIEGRIEMVTEDDEEDVISDWVILKKIEDTLN
jgi:hypothetical protein